MKIGEIIKKKFTISFEFFPPKTDEGEADLFDAIQKLKPLSPDFVSVTYGAGGGTREKTRRIVTRISREAGLNVMAHLTCIGHTKAEILEILRDYRDAGIDDILALRGDTPAGTAIDPQKGEIPHASDLVHLIRSEFDEYFSIGCAAFPERHPESPNWEWEMAYFKKKAEGSDFGITQLFFDNRYFFELLDRMSKNSIAIPIIPGIMPVTNFKQIQKFASMCGATIPNRLIETLQRFQDSADDTAKAGVEYAVGQCEELLKNGVRGLHFYTLNKSNATSTIYESIKSLLPAGTCK